MLAYYLEITHEQYEKLNKKNIESNLFHEDKKYDEIGILIANEEAVKEVLAILKITEYTLQPSEYEEILNISYKGKPSESMPKQKKIENNISVSIVTWQDHGEGKANREAYKEAVLSKLASKIPNKYKNIKFLVPHGKDNESEPGTEKDTFYIQIWGSPRNQIFSDSLSSSKRCWGIPMLCTDTPFYPSGQGIQIYDDTDYCVAELIDNNLYIHHDLCHKRRPEEIDLFNRLLDEVIQIWTIGEKKYTTNRNVLFARNADRALARGFNKNIFDEFGNIICKGKSGINTTKVHFFKNKTHFVKASDFEDSETFNILIGGVPTNNRANKVLSTNIMGHSHPWDDDYKIIGNHDGLLLKDPQTGLIVGNIIGNTLYIPFDLIEATHGVQILESIMKLASDYMSMTKTQKAKAIQRSYVEPYRWNYPFSADKFAKKTISIVKQQIDKGTYDQVYLGGFKSESSASPLHRESFERDVVKVFFKYKNGIDITHKNITCFGVELDELKISLPFQEDSDQPYLLKDPKSGLVVAQVFDNMRRIHLLCNLPEDESIALKIFAGIMNEFTKLVELEPEEQDKYRYSSKFNVVNNSTMNEFTYHQEFVQFMQSAESMFPGFERYNLYCADSPFYNSDSDPSHLNIYFAKIRNQTYVEDIPETLWDRSFPDLDTSYRLCKSFEKGYMIKDPKTNITIAEIIDNNLVIYVPFLMRLDQETWPILKDILMEASHIWHLPDEDKAKYLPRYSFNTSKYKGDIKSERFKTIITNKLDQYKKDDNPLSINFCGYSGKKKADFTFFPQDTSNLNLFMYCANGRPREVGGSGEFWGHSINHRKLILKASHVGFTIFAPDNDQPMVEVIKNNIIFLWPINYEYDDYVDEIFSDILDKALPFLFADEETKKELERKLIKEAKDKYIDACISTRTRKFSDYEAEAESLSKTVKDLQTELAQAIRSKAEINELLTSLSGNNNKLKIKFAEEFELLSDIQKVKNIIVSKTENLIKIFTHVLYCEDPEKDKWHELGEFQINIPTDADLSRFRCFNLTRTTEYRKVESGKTHSMQAPHIFDDGHLCMSNYEETLPIAISEYEFNLVTLLAIQFIEHYNPGDVMGNQMHRWPEVTPEQANVYL